MKIKNKPFKVSVATNNKLRKFHRSFVGKSRVAILLSNPGEARKALKVVADAGAYEFSHPIETLSDPQVLDLMETVLRDVAKREKQEAQ